MVIWLYVWLSQGVVICMVITRSVRAEELRIPVVGYKRNKTNHFGCRREWRRLRRPEQQKG